MSNVSDYIPQQGISPLARIIQSFMPSTASPDTSGTPAPTPAPPPQGGLLPEDPSGRGGFLSGLGIPPPQAPAQFSNLPSTLWDLVRRLGPDPAAWTEEARQPSPWGGPPAAPPEQPQPQQPPDTTGVGGQPAPGQPSPMQPPRTYQFPPSQLPAAAPPADTTPPTADKAPPRQEPYIPSRRDAHPGAWGKRDLVEQGMVDYPTMLPGPYGPQPHEWQGIRQNSQRFLGSMGSGVIAPLARALANLGPAYEKARQAGNEHQARMAAANIALYSKQLALKQAQESRDYGEVFAALGPTDENGKPNPRYDENKLRQAILEVAGKWHDTQKISAALDSGGISAVQRMIASRDASAKDHNKVQIQELRHYQIEAAKLRIKEAQDKQKRRQIIEESGLAPVDGTETTAPGSPAADEGERTHEFDPHFGGPATAAPASEETPDTTETPDTPETPVETPETRAETPEPPAKTAETPSATDEMLRTAEAAAAQTPAAPRPRRLAALETSGVSDVPQPAAPPRAEPLPRTAAAAPPAGAPAAGTPEAMGATAPVPSLQPQEPTPPGRVPMMQEIPDQPPPTTEGGGEAAAPAAPPYDFKFSTRVMDDAAKIRMTDAQGRVRGVDLEGINTLAQQMVNGTIKGVQVKQNYPEWFANLARKRGDEIIRDEQKIATDPRVRPDQVLALEAKINPWFAGQLKTYVEGRAKIPQSAWTNPGFQARTLMLGSKIEPGFNQGTAQTTFKTYDAFTTGKQGDWYTAGGTTYGHAAQLEEKLQKFPGLVARMFGGTSAADLLGVSREDQGRMAEIKALIDTVNSEYEYAVSRGRPTMWARRQQAEQAPLVFGNVTTLLHNLAAKKAMLRTRLGELEAQFRAGTGQQPGALRRRFEEVGRYEAASGLGQAQQDRRAGAPLAPAGEGSPAAQSSGDVIDYQTYFGR